MFDRKVMQEKSAKESGDDADSLFYCNIIG